MSYYQDNHTFQGNPMLDVFSADPIWTYQIMEDLQREGWDDWWSIYERRPYEWELEDKLQSRILYMSGMARRIQRCWFNREELPMACPCPESP